MGQTQRVRGHLGYILGINPEALFFKYQEGKTQREEVTGGWGWR